jgi:hypothetical protein
MALGLREVADLVATGADGRLVLIEIKRMGTARHGQTSPTEEVLATPEDDGTGRAARCVGAGAWVHPERLDTV